MIFGLKVNGQVQTESINPEDPLFSWECDRECQFTIQMAGDPDFLETVMYQDTRNHYCIYDGFPLQEGKTYYWRVRSGVKEWSESTFETGRKK